MTKLPKRWAWKIFFLFIGAIFIYQLWILGHVVFWNFYNPSTSAFMRERLIILKKNSSRVELYSQWISYEHISPHLKRAVITAEDNKFLEHKGFDFEAIQNAYRKNMQRGEPLVGGSTISQQLAKNLFLSNKKTPWRKLEEAIITLMLENVMSKRRILEIYLNIIEWGNGIFGAEAAAHYYYGISSSSLTAEQSAFLTAMITNPRFYDKNRSSPRLLKKMSIILNRMALISIP